MTKDSSNNIKGLQLRAKLPFYFRTGAVVLAIVTAAVVLVSYYRARNPEFRMKGFPTSLSQDVIGTVAGFERREMEGDVLKYYMRADVATTFADNHQELENVYLQVFDTGSGGQRFDEISAVKGVYIPEADNNFTAYFAGSVKIDTRDGVAVKTEQLTYKKATETAIAEEKVEFSRQNLSGSSTGAVVKITEKQLELLQNVLIEAADAENSGVSTAKLRAGYALYDQNSEKIEFRNSVESHLTSKENGRQTDLKADRAIVAISEENGVRDVASLELFGSVNIDSKDAAGKPAKIVSQYGLYEKATDRFTLKDNVEINTAADDKPTVIRAAAAVYDQRSGKIGLSGGAEIAQASDIVKGDVINAELNQQRKLRKANVIGNGYLKQVSADRTSEISGPELNASFDDAQQLTAANVKGQSTVTLIPAKADEYTKITMIAAAAIDVAFRGPGLLEKMQTAGRTTIQLNAPNTAADAANKRVTADAVKTFFNESGKDLSRAEAIGNAELFVDPLRTAAENYRTTITAPRFDCEFFPTGSNAKNCVGGTKTKTVRVPTVPADGRGTQTLLADRLNVLFSETTKNVEVMEASGKTKFSENDRNAVAEKITYSEADKTVRLRGDEPTIWDSSGRAKAPEIDWNTAAQRSTLRGGVSSTYYSQKQTNGSAPFGETNKPVFLTADAAEFDHRTQVAVYSGNARTWQDNNFVRGERLIITPQAGEFRAEGSVQSLLYDAKRKEGGRETTVPVYASSAKMTYNRDQRKLRYETDVDIRQGTDRITGNSADVFLSERNEVARTDIAGSVVITQPQRKAAADTARYNAADESVVLQGNVRVSDAVSGASEGGMMTIFLKEDRVINSGTDNKTSSPGRTRTVYKVNN